MSTQVETDLIARIDTLQSKVMFHRGQASDHSMQATEESLEADRFTDLRDEYRALLGAWQQREQLSASRSA